MKALLFGSNGQLGRALQTSAPLGVDLYALTRSDCDLRDESAVLAKVAEISPNVILNASAYTAVDQAEDDEANAYLVNEKAVEAMVQGAHQCGARVIHVSTDFVFPGDGANPYRPDDEVGPLSVYGKSKLAGERVLRDTDLLVRTAWVYDADGRNFLNTMLRLFGQRDEVRVVNDQVGTPTFAGDLAEALWALIDKGASGTMHYTNSGIASWYDFAVAIRDEATALGILHKDVSLIPISSAEYPTPATRPHYSVLDCSETYAAIGGPARHWRAALEEVLKDKR